MEAVADRVAILQEHGEEGWQAFFAGFDIDPEEARALAEGFIRTYILAIKAHGRSPIQGLHSVIAISLVIGYELGAEQETKG